MMKIKAPKIIAVLFAGGLRLAQTDQARAAHEASVATYRQTVLTGFQQVEDQLATLRILAQQAEIEAQAVASAQTAERIILNQYKAGIVAYTNVVTAQATALTVVGTSRSFRRALCPNDAGGVEDGAKVLPPARKM